jgi:hypothetical protein
MCRKAVGCGYPEAGAWLPVAQAEVPCKCRSKAGADIFSFRKLYSNKFKRRN